MIHRTLIIAWRFVAVLILFAAAAPGLIFAQEATCSAKIERGKHHFGLYHLGEQHYRQALAAFVEASEDPGCAYEAAWRLADLCLCWGTWQTDPKQKRAHFQKGMAYAQRAIELAPEGKHGHYQYAVNLGSIVQMEGVMKALVKARRIKKANAKALAADGDFAPALVVEARFMADLPGIFGGSDERAEALFRKAIASDPHWETAYVELAAFLLKRKRPDEAKAFLDKLLAPNFPHRFAAPWLTLDEPRARALYKTLGAGSPAPTPEP